MGVDPADPPRAPSPAAAKGAAEAQKLEVDSSRRPVDGNQRYELSSRSKSPMNKLADGCLLPAVRAPCACMCDCVRVSPRACDALAHERSRLQGPASARRAG
jgi:hypothetical protein